MKKCELCGGLARMKCESDQADLCWDCDMKVHGANFLVAKHTRTLLCHVCQNPTPWFASGHYLCPAVSVCDSCVGNDNKRNSFNFEVISQQEESSEEEYEEDEDEDEVEDGDNQVVPWSGDSSSFSMSKPVACLDSSSSSEGRGGGDGGGGGFGLKRMRESPSFCPDDEIGCSSSHVGSGGPSNGEATSMSSSRLMKQPRLCEVNQSARHHDHDETESRSMAIIST